MSGGGFMNNSQSGESPNAGGKSAHDTSLRPVMVHQVLQAVQPNGESDWLIDGVAAGTISMVACVRNVTKSTAMTTYLVEDGTGQVDVRKWAESEIDPADEDNPDDWKNCYVRIIGSIKTFADKTHVLGIVIRLVEDKNEVLFHAVEAVHAHLGVTRGPPGGAPAPVIRPGTVNPYQDNSNDNGVAAAYADMNVTQRRIMQTISSKSEGLSEGVHIQMIHRELPSITAETLHRECAALIEDGHLYTTVDEDHFLPTA